MVAAYLRRRGVAQVMTRRQLQRCDALFEKFYKDKEAQAAVQGINKLLASGATAKEIEGSVLKLVAKRTTDDADVSLAAVMLDYYETYLQAELEAGNIQPSDVFKEMLAQDEVLTTEAYGASTATARHITRR